VGLDLGSKFFEPPPFSRLHLQEGSVLNLPFEDGSFDIVASYQMLEHVPDPRTALSEMLRVLKPGGTIAIVSPNILSPLGSLRGIGVYVWRNRPFRTILFRSSDMPRHPWGNTLPELLASLVGNSFLLLKKLVCEEPGFTMRTPDLKPPFHSDNDACYICNPVDLIKFFRSKGCRIIQNGRPGRLSMSWFLVTGTYVAAQKL